MPVSPEIWLAFAAAAALLVAIPGPTTLMVMGHTMASGTRIGLLSLIGVTVGDLCAITLSVLGFSALLAASATAFLVLKWLGAAYFVWIVIKLLRSQPADLHPLAPARACTGHAPPKTLPLPPLNPHE